MVKKIAERGYVFLVLGLMYLPIIMVIIFSFSNTSRFAFPDGFTLEGYKSLFTDAPNKLWESLGNTVLIAVVSSVAATVIGSVAAIGIYYMKQADRRKHQPNADHQFRNRHGRSFYAVFHDFRIP